MPITLQEISTRALAFSREWKHAESEDADAKSFLDAFFEVFGISRRRVASFEKRVKKIDGKDGYIDLLWKGTLLKQIEAAFGEALDWEDLPERIGCRISKEINKGWLTPEAEWPTLQDQIIDMAVRLDKALKGPIQSLKA